jgi:acetylornithine deacetylase
MKGGVAAMLDAAAAIAAHGGLARGRLIVACVIDEEYASAGADALAASWRADAAIIPEPTGLAIGITHKGFSAAEITVHGKAAHGSRPDEGIDAILHMGRVLARLEARDRELQSGAAVPLLGTGSLHASAIDGGGELSSYPARCRLQFERRTLPGEPVCAAFDDLRQIAAELSAADQHFKADVRLLLARPPYAIDSAHPVAAVLATACGAHGLRARFEGLSYWTDAAILGAAGTPTVLFGPRGAGLHGIQEFVLIDDVVLCRDVLEDAARRHLDERL